MADEDIQERRLSSLLVKLSQLADEEELKTLKFLLYDKISRRGLEQCRTMLDVFQKMKEKMLITSSDISYLKELLTQVYRNNRAVKEMLLKYEAEEPHGIFPSVSNTAEILSLPDMSISSGGATTNYNKTPTKRFANAFTYASSHIGEDWKIFGRLGGIPTSELLTIENTHSGNVQSQALLAFEKWYSNQTRPSMKGFRQILRDIPRNDIADELKDSQNN